MGKRVKERGEGRRYAGKSPEERRHERRERLYEAGLEMFATDGYAATTIEGLCLATHLNPRYFYEEFGSRERLLRAIYDRIDAEAAVGVLRAVEAAPLDLRARLEAGTAGFARTMLADPRKARIYCVEVVGVSDDLERHRRKRMRENARILADLVAPLVDDGQLPDRDYTLTARALIGAAGELLLDWVADRRTSKRAVVEELVELYVAAFSRPARAET